MSIMVDLSGEHLNQCDIPSTSDLAPLRHKCKPSTTCVPTLHQEPGVRFGSYTCLCNPGGTIPQRVNTSQSETTTQFDGVLLEREYHRMTQGLPNSYRTSYSCVPCNEACDWPFCIGDVTCFEWLELQYRLPVMVVTMVTMFGVLVLMGLTFRFRNDKMMKASSPGLMFVTLSGALLLYTEVIIVALNTSHLTCMIRPWVRHIGFSLAYGGVLLKTWRISIIMRVFKSRAFKTRDSELYKKVCLMTISWILFLVLWTVVDPAFPVPVANSPRATCNTDAWSYVAHAGELALLAWGACLCYQARKAPNLYNETRQVSYVLWNEAIWQVFLILGRCLLLYHPDPKILLLVYFLRTEFTVTTMLVLIYTPKFIIMFRKIRQVHGTLTDVYGSRRVHRLSLMINKHGDIKTIYCTPCGPLAYIDQSEESDSSRDSHHQNIKEDEYSKAEVDSLIELVSRLKSERELYKMQVKRLVQLLRSSRGRRPPNGLSPALVAEDPSGNRRPIDLTAVGLADGGGGAPAEGDDVGGRGDGGCDGGEELYGEPSSRSDLEEAQFFECVGASAGGPRSSRASTVTTFVSSSTPDEASMSDFRLSMEGQPPPSSPSSSPSAIEELPASTTTPLRRRNDLSPPCRKCGARTMTLPTGGNGISRYALTVLTRKLARNHLLGGRGDLSPEDEADPEEFPRMLHSHDDTYDHHAAPDGGDGNHDNNNKMAPTSTTKLIPTVYGDFCDSHMGRELQDLTPNTHAQKVPMAAESSELSTRGPKTPTSSEKLNFIMYI